MSLIDLAERARAAGVGKRAFAGALDVVPADVGKRIETMSDQDRYRLAQLLGIVG